MEYSIVNYSDILRQFDMRFDADYYKPKYLREDKQLNKHESILVGDFSFVTDGQHGYHEVDENSPILHLTAKNAKDWFANTIGADRIAKWVDDKNKRSSLVENDLILSTRGTVGYCAIVKSNVLPANIDQDVARIAISDDFFLPEYLLTFLNCEFGQGWIKRNTTGMVQQGLSLQKVRQAPIPLLGNNFQYRIKTIVDNAHTCITNSELLFANTQTILLSELGLTNWQPKHQLTFVKNYSDTEQAGRIDAEYFQPKYEEIIKAIKNYHSGWDTLKNLCELVGHPSNPPYADTDDTDKTFIVTQKHLGDFSLNDEFWNDAEALYTTREFIDKNCQYVLKKGDVLLYSVGAYIGKANIYMENVKATIGSFLTLLRTKKDRLNPYYLMSFLNTDVGIAISKQHQRGMAQQYLYPYDIRTFPIPLLPEQKQTEIQQKVTESFALRKQSKHLLECAKRAVEIAIEQDEKKAINWLKEQTQDIANGVAH